MIETFHQAKPDRITGRLEYDWYRGAGGFDRQRTGCCGRGDDGDLPMDEIRCETRQPVKATIGPAIFDSDVLTFTVTRLLQSCLECGLKIRARIGSSEVEVTDNGLARLLCARRKRPCDG